jgi:hypothetical protein
LRIIVGFLLAAGPLLSAYSHSQAQQAAANIAVGHVANGKAGGKILFLLTTESFSTISHPRCMRWAAILIATALAVATGCSVRTPSSSFTEFKPSAPDTTGSVAKPSPQPETGSPNARLIDA